MLKVIDVKNGAAQAYERARAFDVVDAPKISDASLDWPVSVDIITTTVGHYTSERQASALQFSWHKGSWVTHMDAGDVLDCVFEAFEERIREEAK